MLATTHTVGAYKNIGGFLLCTASHVTQNIQHSNVSVHIRNAETCKNISLPSSSASNQSVWFGLWMVGIVVKSEFVLYLLAIHSCDMRARAIQFTQHDDESPPPPLSTTFIYNESEIWALEYRAILYTYYLHYILHILYEMLTNRYRLKKNSHYRHPLIRETQIILNKIPLYFH